MKGEKNEIFFVFCKKTLINNFSVLIGAFSFYALNSYNDSLKSWILMPAISMFCITVLLCFFDLKSKTENADKEIKIISCISCIGILLFYSKKFYNNFGMQQSWIDSIVDFSRTSKNIYIKDILNMINQMAEYYPK